MSIDFNGKVDGSAPVAQSRETNQLAKTASKRLEIKIKNGNPATKKITEKNIETAVNEPSSKKALNELLNNSPIGLTEHQSSNNIEQMGYTFVGTGYHQGAPKIYQSSDGGTITVYDGKGTANMGEDKKKIVYQNGRYTQEMYYDDNGKLTGGKVTIKDDVAGFTEKQYDFTVKDNKIASIII